MDYDNYFFMVNPSDDQQLEEEDFNWSCPIYFSNSSNQHPLSQLPNQNTSWKPLEKKKTVYVALVMCLHVGVDPPDNSKPSPCARLECWQNPLQLAHPKPADAIGQLLQHQYERMQQRARYKLLPDPTHEEVQKACITLRKNAKDDRVLIHYNGHGVPRPTTNGEIWVFNKNFTQYMPLSVLDVNKWTQGPTVYVFDCSNAGVIIDTFRSVCISDAQLDVICFGACGKDELLPVNPELPADLFTSCLTTPIRTALRWYCMQNPDSLPEGVDADTTDKIPGKTTDRRTPLGELNWIFTAITDTIGWSVLPVNTFQRLFRQDNLIAGLSRNYLLAVRIMRSYGCNPSAEPVLPDTANHPMWKAWDLVCDMCVKQLPRILSSDPAEQREYEFSTFFSEQLQSFDTFLTQIKFSGYQKPTLLPIVLQVLLAQHHRPKALELLKQFLDVDVQAVMSSLSVGVFPYIARLLSNNSGTDVLPSLISIYAKIIALDGSFYSALDMPRDCYVIMFKDVMSNSNVFSTYHRTLAIYIITRLIMECPDIAESIVNKNFISTCQQQLEENEDPVYRMWITICLGVLWNGCDAARRFALRTQILEKLFELLYSCHPEIRTAALFSLGTFVENSNIISDENGKDHMFYDPDSTDGENGKTEPFFTKQKTFAKSPTSDAQMDTADERIAYNIIKLQYDISEMVRRELVVALSHFVMENESTFIAKFSDDIPDESEPWTSVDNGSMKYTNNNRNHLLPSPSSKDFRNYDKDPGSSGDEYMPRHSPEFRSLERSRKVSAPAKFYHADALRRNMSSGTLVSPQLEKVNAFKSIWDTIINLYRDPCESVSSLAAKLVNRIRDGENDTRPPESILVGSDTFTNNHHRLPDTSAQRSKHVPQNNNTSPVVNFNLTSQKVEFDISSPAAPATSSGPPEKFALNTDFVDYYTKLMLEPLSSWPFRSEHTKSYTFDNMIRFRENARVRIKFKKRKNSIRQAQVTAATSELDWLESFPQPAITKFHFEPFNKACYLADTEKINYFKWGTQKTRYVCLHTASKRAISPSNQVKDFALLNAHENPMVLYGTATGCFRIYKSTGQTLQKVSAFQGFQSNNAEEVVFSWNQFSGNLFAAATEDEFGSRKRTCMRVWDLHTQSLSLEKDAVASVSCLLSYSHLPSAEADRASGIFYYGQTNGSVYRLDSRQSSLPIEVSREHNSKIINLSLFSDNNLITAAHDGSVKLWDLRKQDNMGHSIATHGFGDQMLKHVTVSQTAPIFACSFHTSSSIHLHSLFDGKFLCSIKRSDGFAGMSNRVTNELSHLEYHPQKPLLGASYKDGAFCVYRTEEH